MEDAAILDVYVSSAAPAATKRANRPRKAPSVAFRVAWPTVENAATGQDDVRLQIDEESQSRPS